MSFNITQWKIIYLHPAAWISLLLVLVHQFIVAGSVFFLTQVIELFQAGKDFSLYLSIFLASMAAPYLPGCLSIVLLQTWINRAHCAFVEYLARHMLDRTEQCRDATLKERVESVMARNSYPVIGDYISFVHDLASFLLNSVLSMIVIGFLLPTRLLWGYSLSILLCLFIVISLRKIITFASADYENKYISYSDILNRSWENMTLGNRHNQEIWNNQKNVTGHVFYSASYRLQLLKQSGNVLLAGASLGPTIFLIASVVTDNRIESSMIAAILVSLTRIFLIINSFSALVFKFLDWSSMKARLEVLFDVRSSISATNMSDAGVIGKIAINGTAITGTPQAVEIVTRSQHGRFKITGSNGSGKSTILLALKSVLGSRSFILPAHHGDLMWKISGATLSTGQKTQLFLKEIFDLKEIDFLLLDEWDANLDTRSTLAIDDALNDLSKSKIVIEIRH
jgi:ABC-type bacteriocin/lantibiotic exporter with double-glycine peptidase domain